MDCDSTGDFDQQLTELIHYKSRSLLGHYGFGREDIEDLRQDLAAQVVVGLRKHDPRRSTRRTFASRIIQNKIASLIAHARAQKRDRQRLEPIEDEGQIIGCRLLTNMDLPIDVEVAMASLTPELRAIAELFKTLDESAIVRHTGKSRQQIRTAKAQIAIHFRKHGLMRHLHLDQPDRQGTQ